MKTYMEVTRGEKPMPRLVSTTTLFAILLGLLLAAAAPALAQNPPRIELGVNYTYVRANAPPGDCGCFSLNGGAGWLAVDFTHSLAVVGEVGSVHTGNVLSTGNGFTLTSYLAGVKYERHMHRILSPFGQILLGGARADGPLTPLKFGVAGPANAFAMVAGGGLDIGLSRHWAVRAAEVDYYLTRFDNADNDHQNNLRVSGGLLVRF
jgi:outer membrane immunogenic protein